MDDIRDRYRFFGKNSCSLKEKSILGVSRTIRHETGEKGKNVESWLMQGFLMFGPPVVGALVVRGNPTQWQRWLGWAFMCFCAYALMSGAGWDPSRASLAIVVASLLGAFSAEIIPAIAGNLNKNSLVGLMVIALFVWGLIYASVSEAHFKNLVQWVVVGILVFVGIRAAKKG